MNRPAGSDEILIRPASSSDARLLSSLGTVTFYEAYFEQDDPHSMADYLVEHFAPEMINTELSDPRSHFFIAFRRGRAVGYAKLKEGPPHESVDLPKPVELQRFYTVERVWGTGVADPMLDYCLRAAGKLGKGSVWLGVWEENPRAIAFYGRHGFERVGSLNFPYGASVGINAVMQLALDGLD